MLYKIIGTFFFLIKEEATPPPLLSPLSVLENITGLIRWERFYMQGHRPPDPGKAQMSEMISGP